MNVDHSTFPAAPGLNAPSSSPIVDREALEQKLPGMNWTTEKLRASTPRHLILTRVHPDGRIERRILSEAEAEERWKRADEALDFETGELKTTRALREKYGGK